LSFGSEPGMLDKRWIRYNLGELQKQKKQ
ncbi:MAG: hypothetical protein EZS28_023585, partial [Streblomastix strix]